MSRILLLVGGGALAAVMLLLASATLHSPVTRANQTGANTAAQLCQELSNDGTLASLGINVGDCVNLIKGPASDQANNFISAICSVDFIQAEVGASNRGQCIKIVRTLI